MVLALPLLTCVVFQIVIRVWLRLRPRAIPFGWSWLLENPWRKSYRDPERVAAQCGIASTDTVLEIGCGSGLFTRALATRCAKLIAQDIEPRYVAQTKAKLSDLSHIEYLTCDARDLELIGVADVIAELLVIAFLDRIGKRRAVLIAGIFYALAFILFWALSASLLGMMIALFAIFLGFEFTLVASLPIASETVPESRAAMMGWNAAFIATGRIIGSLIALPLFGSDRMWLVALVGCVAIGSSVVFMALSTRSTLKLGAS